MKKIYAMSFAALLVSAAYAQKPKINSARIINNEPVNYRTESVIGVSNNYSTNRTASLNETFEVSVPPIGWAANDFLISNATQESKATGNAGHYAYFEASNRPSGTEGILTTPALQPAVGNNTLAFKVNYYVMNLAWKDAGAKLFIEFSENGGTTWTTSTDNILASLSNYNVSTTGWTAKTVDLTAYNGKNVLVRFRGVADYGMANIGIDDVTGPTIYLPKNDVAAKKITLSMNGVGFCQLTPASQLDSVYFAAQVINSGTDAQTNVTLKANINNDVDFAAGYKNPIASLASGQIDTIWVSTKPKKVNDTTEVDYGAKIWATQDQNDEIPSNNLVDSAFFSTTSTAYIRTVNYNTNYSTYTYANNSVPAKTGFEFGTKYLIIKDTRIDTLFGFVSKSVGSGNIVAKLYTISYDSAKNFVYTLVASSDTVKPVAGPSSKFTNLALKTPYQCKANTMLAAMIQFNGDMGTTNKDSLWVGADGDFPSNPAAASLAYMNVSGTMGWYTLPAVPLVGIEIEKIKLWGVGVKENTISKANIFPNPTSSQLNVNFNTASAATVELINVVGQVIELRNVASGSVSTSFDMAHVNAGIYFVRIKSEQGQSTYKVIKN